MNKRKRKRKHKCLHCGKLYIPDPRTIDRQKHCSAPECKRASKAWRQHRWLNKTENKDYFRGSQNTDRVQTWRRSHPGYWRRGTKSKNALQDDCSSQLVEHQEDKTNLARIALQDDCLLQPPLIVGLIAQLTGSALQDDIAISVRRMHTCGQNILGIGPGMTEGGKCHDSQTSLVP